MLVRAAQHADPPLTLTQHTTKPIYDMQAASGERKRGRVAACCYLESRAGGQFSILIFSSSILAHAVLIHNYMLAIDDWNRQWCDRSLRMKSMFLGS